MQQKKIWITYIALLISAILWGYSFIWSIKLLQFYEPITIILMRLIVASAFLFLVGIVFKKIDKLQKQDVGIFALLAFCEPFMYFIGETYGLKMSSATISSVIVATIPLFSPIATWFFFKEKFKIINILGIIISIVGVFLVILSDDYQFKASLNGILLLFLAVFSAIGYSVVVVKITEKYNVFSIIFYQSLLGVLYFIPLFLIFDYDHFITVKMTFEIIKPLISLAIFGSSIAFMLFTYGLKELGIVRANSVANIIPVFTAIFSYFMLNETLSWVNVSGIFIVLFGLFLSQRQKNGVKTQ